MSAGQWPSPAVAHTLAKLLINLPLNGHDPARMAEPWCAIVPKVAARQGAGERRLVLEQELTDHEYTEEAINHVLGLVARADPSGSGSAAAYGFTTQTAVELDAETFPDLVWIVPGMITEGATLLVGSPKAGKSLMMLGLAYAVSVGGAVLANIRVEKHEVLYFALEDGKRRIQRRLRKIRQAGPTPPGLHIAYVGPGLGAGLLAGVEAWLQDHPDTKLVVIDTLAATREQTTDQSSYQKDYQEMHPFSILAQKYGVAIVVVHHARKMHSDDAMDMVNGTQGMAGAVDCVILLSRERNSAEAKLSVMGRDLDEEAEFALHWDPVIGAYANMGKAAEVKLSSERSEIMAALKSSRDPLTVRQVADLTGHPQNSTLRLTLRRMVDDCQILSPSYGKYTARQVFGDD